MDIKKIIVLRLKKFHANFMPPAFSPAPSMKTPNGAYSLLSVVWLRKLSRLEFRVLQFLGYVTVILLLGINTLHANMSEEITILPTIKAPSLLQVNTVGTAQFAVKNLSQKTVKLAIMPQKGVTQDTAGLLVCHHSFTLMPGQQCLLNLKITGHKLKIGHKITYGPLICQADKKGRVKRDVSFCAQPTIRDRLNITIVTAKKTIIEVKPQTLNIHAESVTPDMLAVINHSETQTAQNITADLPDSWNDVKQNANDCVSVKPKGTCKIFFIAKHAHSVETIMVSGRNTTKFPVKIRVEPHDVKKFGPPARH